MEPSSSKTKDDQGERKVELEASGDEGLELQEDGLGGGSFFEEKEEEEDSDEDIKVWTQVLSDYLVEAKEDNSKGKVSSILKRDDESNFLLASLEHKNRVIVSAGLDLMEELLSMGANRKLIKQEHPDIIETLDTIRTCGDGVNSRDAETMYRLLQTPVEKEPPLPEYIQDDENESDNHPGAVWYKNEDKSDEEQSIFGKIRSFWQDSFYW